MNIFHSYSGTKYNALPTVEHTERQDDIERSQKAQGRPALSSSSLAVVICVLCTMANAVVSLYAQFPSSNGLESFDFLRRTPRLARQDISKLRRPSQFIGFDRINRSLAPEAKQLTNYPFLMSQIDSSSEYTVTNSAESTRDMTEIGMIVHERSRMTVTNTVSSLISQALSTLKSHLLFQISTIVQFRSIDYGMEKCEITLSIPAEKSSDVSALSLSPSPFSIRLSLMQEPFALDPHTLSWSTRPSVVSNIATFQVSRGITWNRNLSCEIDELLTFELSCADASEDCQMEWWQERDEDFPGNFLVRILVAIALTRTPKQYLLGSIQPLEHYGTFA